MAYGSILGQTTPGVGAAIISGVVNDGETINAGDVVNVNQSWNVNLSTVQVGDIINLPENGAPTKFYIGSVNYEPMLNTGESRVLLVRKDVYQIGAWNSTNINAYANSTMDTWFNNIYKTMLDNTIIAEIGETTFYYTPGNGNNTVTTLSRSVFALSMTELGYSDSNATVEGSRLSNYLELRVAYLNQIAQKYWLRTPHITLNYVAWVSNTNNDDFNLEVNRTNMSYYRPCFTLPGTFQTTYPTTITKQGTPYQAIALSSGTSGQTIQAIYSGIVYVPWITAGQQINSTGVQGYGVKDGMLEVFPYYRPQ